MLERRSGTGHLRSGQHDLGTANYEIHVGWANKQWTVVELESPPGAQEGEILDLLLEDGQVLQLHVRGVSPYCRVIGGRPIREQREDKETAESSEMDYERRRSDTRNALAIQHPCPRCMASEVVVTHRGVMMTTLFCTACRHGWGEPPAVVAAATRMDRRTLARPDSGERRGPGRLQTPTCTYCATNVYVRGIRRTSDQVFFACDGCEVMWALPRRPDSHHASLESR